MTVTLNRPRARNALNTAPIEAPRREVILAETSPEVSCVVVRVAGNAFCAGGDIRNNDIRPQNVNQSDERIEWMRTIQRDTTGRLYAMPKPTLAVINGPAAGVGLSMACDLRIMSRSAFLLTAFVTVGLQAIWGRPIS